MHELLDVHAHVFDGRVVEVYRFNHCFIATYASAGVHRHGSKCDVKERTGILLLVVRGTFQLWLKKELLEL